MKRVLLLALLLVVSACSHQPTVPCDDLVTGCSAAPTGRPVKIASTKFRDARHTVQLMIQEPTLINGRPADTALWPASVYAKSNGGACSATLVGERVLFIAGHCMAHNSSVTFSAGANQYKARCSHHPEYRSGNSTADWALCLVERPVTGVPFEAFGLDEILALEQEIRLSGYGCIRPGGGGGNDGIFRIGEAVIKGLPNGRNYDIYTVGGAALCFGDSGGAAYDEKSDGKRFIVGVNSRGDIDSESYLPAVFTSAFKTFLTSWTTANSGAKVCGFHKDALYCRNDSINPPPPPADGKFEINSKAACVKGVVQPNYLPRKDEVIKSVKDALEKY